MLELPETISTHHYSAKFSFNEAAKKAALIPVNSLLFILESLSSAPYNPLWPDKKNAWAQATKQDGDIYQITEYTQAVEMNGFYQGGTKKLVSGYFSAQEAVEWLKDKEQSYIKQNQSCLRQVKSSHFTTIAANLDISLR